jgi:hypothetical protein
MSSSGLSNLGCRYLSGKGRESGDDLFVPNCSDSNRKSGDYPQPYASCEIHWGRSPSLPPPPASESSPPTGRQPPPQEALDHLPPGWGWGCRAARWGHADRRANDLREFLSYTSPILQKWMPPHWGFYVDDVGWQVGYPYDLEGRSVTVFELVDGWAWGSSPTRLSTQHPTEQVAKLDAVKTCLGRGG